MSQIESPRLCRIRKGRGSPAGRGLPHLVLLAAAGRRIASTTAFVAALALSGVATAQSRVVAAGDRVCDSASNGNPLVELAPGGIHLTAGSGEGSVIAWGDNTSGQIDVPALPAGLSYVEVAAGGWFAAARRSDGSIVAWGYNQYGQCDVPALPAGLSYVEVVAGGYHALALRSDGSLVAWGFNGYGECDVPALPPGLSYVGVSAGYTFSAALRSDGSILAWGENTSRQCEVPALPAGVSYVSVAAGLSYAVARRSDGSIVAWGSHQSGAPNGPAVPPGVIYVELSACGTTVARRSDGSVVAWGDNSVGQCDVPALPPGLSYVEVSAGWQHNTARRSDGSVVAWGWNGAGECDVPALAPDMSFAELAAGYSFTVARVEPSPACGSVSFYCRPAPSNSASASGASFTIEGCPGLTANDLFFSVSGLPPGKRGIFYYGSQSCLPFGHGLPCIGGTVQRIAPPLIADANGVVGLPIDLAQYPFQGGANPITSGSSWNFQFWYRDPAGAISTYNFSDAQHIVFAP